MAQHIWRFVLINVKFKTHMQNGQFSQPGKIYILLLKVIMFHSFDIYKISHFILTCVKT